MTAINNKDRLIERFWEKVVPGPANECWLWTGMVLINVGYGYLQTLARNGPRKVITAHRLSYHIHKGDPGKLYVLHTCDNRLCVNPNHLFLGTHLENLEDMYQKQRHSHGESHGMHKLNESQVREIRRRADTGENQGKIAADFGISRTSVHDVRFKSWQHLTP
jgi:HNH endonuclease